MRIPAMPSFADDIRQAAAGCMYEKEFEMCCVEIERLVSERDTLLAALKASRATLDRANTIGSECAITDTIWHTKHETLFDFMDEAIASIESPQGERK